MRLLPATLLFSLALPACKPSPAFLAHGCLAITDRATCMASPEASAPVESKGTLDGAYAGQYTCNVLVEDTSLPSSVEVVNVEVQVIDPSTQAVLVEFTAPTSASLSPSTPFAAASVVLVDPVTVTALSGRVAATGRVQEVVTSFTMVGRTPDGTKVSAPPVAFPVDISLTASCVSPVGQPCSGPQAKPMTDCAIGIDEPAGTSCQAIAGMLGLCHFLECTLDPMTGKSDLATATCPAHVPVDDSCCNP